MLSKAANKETALRLQKPLAFRSFNRFLFNVLISIVLLLRKGKEVRFRIFWQVS